MVTDMAMKPRKRRKWRSCVAQSIQLPIVIQRSIMVRINIGADIPSFEKYDLMYGLSTRLRSIIFTPDFDERIYRNMAKRRNGVVGRIGTNTPMPPSTTHIVAIVRYINFVIIVAYGCRSLE